MSRLADLRVSRRRTRIAHIREEVIARKGSVPLTRKMKVTHGGSALSALARPCGASMQVYPIKVICEQKKRHWKHLNIASSKSLFP